MELKLRKDGAFSTYTQGMTSVHLHTVYQNTEFVWDMFLTQITEG